MTDQLPAEIAEAIDGLQFAYEAVGQDAVLHEARKALDAVILKHLSGEWRPMESAPQDDRLLALVDGDVRIIAYGKTSHVPIYGWCLADQGAEEFDLCEPTGWMPMPSTDLGRAALAENGRE